MIERIHAGLCLCVAGALLFASTADAEQAFISLPRPAAAPASFAADEIEAALRARNFEVVRVKRDLDVDLLALQSTVHEIGRAHV